MENESYWIIHSFMVKHLNLKGAELNIYAIIYSYSKDGQGEYYGSIDYLCKLTDLARSTVFDALKSLTEKGFLLKKEVFSKGENGVKYCKYKVATIPKIGTYHQTDHTENQTDHTENQYTTIPKISTNNKSYIKKENKGGEENTTPPIFCHRHSDMSDSVYNSANSDREIHKKYEPEIIFAYQNVAGFTVDKLELIQYFKTDNERKQFTKAVKASKYDISACIEQARKDGANKVNWAEFYGKLFGYMQNGKRDTDGNDLIPRLYTEAELKEKQRIKDNMIREKEELEKENTLEKEKQKEAFNQEIAMLFNLDIQDVDNFIENYEGGYTEFFKEQTKLKAQSLERLQK